MQLEQREKMTLNYSHIIASGNLAPVATQWRCADSRSEKITHLNLGYIPPNADDRFCSPLLISALLSAAFVVCSVQSTYYGTFRHCVDCAVLLLLCYFLFKSEEVVKNENKHL